MRILPFINGAAKSRENSSSGEVEYRHSALQRWLDDSGRQLRREQWPPTSPHQGPRLQRILMGGFLGVNATRSYVFLSTPVAGRGHVDKTHAFCIGMHEACRLSRVLTLLCSSRTSPLSSASVLRPTKVSGDRGSGAWWFHSYTTQIGSVLNRFVS